MIRKIILCAICFTLVASGTLFAYDAKWAPENEPMKIAEPQEGDDVYVKKPLPDEEKKIFDKIYEEEMKLKYQPAPDYVGEGFEEQTVSPPATGFGAPAVQQPTIGEATAPLETGTATGAAQAPVGTGLPGAQPIPIGQTAGAPAAGGCQGPSIGLFDGNSQTATGQQGTGQSQGSNGQNYYYEDDYYPPTSGQAGAGTSQGSTRPPGQYYHSDEELQQTRGGADEEDNEDVQQ